MIALILELQLLEKDGEEDVSIGCGAVALCGLFSFISKHNRSIVQCDTQALFGGIRALWRTFCPAPLPAEWWVSTCAEVDVTSIRLSAVLDMTNRFLRLLESASALDPAWAGALLPDVVHIVR